MRVLGVDPGSKSGAWALLETSGAATVGDIPVVKDGVNAAEWFRVVQSLYPNVAVVERVGSMPHQGVSSSFNFGRGVGMILGVLAAAGVEVRLVTPQVWKRHYALPGKDKPAALQRAVELFPSVTGLTRVKDHGRAEALLMAKYFVEVSRGKTDD